MSPYYNPQGLLSVIKLSLFLNSIIPTTMVKVRICHSSGKQQCDLNLFVLKNKTPLCDVGVVQMRNEPVTTGCVEKQNKASTPLTLGANHHAKMNQGQSPSRRDPIVRQSFLRSLNRNLSLLIIYLLPLGREVRILMGIALSWIPMAIKNPSAFTFTMLEIIKLRRSPKFQSSILNRKQIFPIVISSQTQNMPPRSLFSNFQSEFIVIALRNIKKTQ